MTTWRRNNAGIDAFVHSVGAQRALASTGAKLARTATTNMPTTGDREIIPKGDGPAYQVSRPRPSMQGESVHVFTDDSGGHLAEFGSVNNPPYAPLRRALLAHGLHLRSLP